LAEGVGLSQISGTIKSQGQLDGKFRANVADRLLKYLLFSRRRFPGDVTIRSFWRDPQPQTERDQSNRADPAEPEGYEPEQALPQRVPIWLRGRRQW
jgi:hypothetical protein